MSAYYPEFDENTLLGEWLSYWLETYVKPTAKPSSYEHYRDNCEKHIIPSLGEVQPPQPLKSTDSVESVLFLCFSPYSDWRAVKAQIGTQAK